MYRSQFSKRWKGYLQLLSLVGVLLILAFLLLPHQTKCAGQGFDYVFLLDTSGSMMGKPAGSGNLVIFPRVKEAISEFLDDIEPGANVFIYPFDKGIHDARRFEIKDRSDIQDVKDYIDSLPAEGSYTWIYRSLKDAIDRITSFRSEGHVVLISLYTDGLDNDRSKKYTMADVMKYFRLRRGDHDWLYYCTLGVKLPAEQRRLLERTSRVKVVETRKGVVNPMLLIEVRIPVMNYGNLLKSGGGIRTQEFLIHSKEKLPAGLKISVEPEFPALRSMGVLAEVKPSSFSPQRKVNFELSFLNIESLEREREYKGTYTFTTNNEMVLVVPQKINVKFNYRTERIVNIFLANNESFPIKFGKLNILKEEVSVTRKKRLVLDYNTSAKEKGGTLKVYAKPSPKNPSLLTCEKNLIINNKTSEYVVVHPPTREIELKVAADKDLKPGKYQGTLNFESEDLTIRGKGLKTQKDEPGIQFVPWSFVVPKKPTPPWVWGVIFLCVAGGAFAIVKYKTKPPTISDLKLDVRTPDRRELDFAGRTEIKLGKGGEDLQDAEASFVIRARKEAGKVFAVLEVSDGEVYLKKQGEREENTIFGEERIFDGDTLRFGDYKVRVSSFSLMRE